MTVTNIPLTYSKDELIEALEALRPAMVAEDEAYAADLERWQKNRLKRFKAACREAAKVTTTEAIVEAKDLISNASKLVDDSGTGVNLGWGCRRSAASRVDSAVGMVRKLRQDRFTIQANGKWGELFDLLTMDVAEIETTCR